MDEVKERKWGIMQVIGYRQWALGKAENSLKSLWLIAKRIRKLNIEWSKYNLMIQIWLKTV